MANLLRVPDVRARGDRPASEAYVARVTARPAFGKAHADQLAQFAAADEARSNPGCLTALPRVLLFDPARGVPQGARTMGSNRNACTAVGRALGCWSAGRSTPPS